MRKTIDDLLVTNEQKAYWQFLVVRMGEYLENGFKGRIVIDIQAKRINSIADQALIAGLTQISFYTNKVS